MPAVRVTATSDTCAVSSLCVYRAPTVFDQDEEGHVVVLVETPPDAVYEAVHRAARGCPTQSIHVAEVAGAMPYPDKEAEDAVRGDHV